MYKRISVNQTGQKITNMFYPDIQQCHSSVGLQYYGKYKQSFVVLNTDTAISEVYLASVLPEKRIFFKVFMNLSSV